MPPRRESPEKPLPLRGSVAVPGLLPAPESGEQELPACPPTALLSGPAVGSVLLRRKAARSAAEWGLFVAAGFFSACTEPPIPYKVQWETALLQQNSVAGASPESLWPPPGGNDR